MRRCSGTFAKVVCVTIPGLQRTTRLRLALRCARDTPVILVPMGRRSHAAPVSRNGPPAHARALDRLPSSARRHERARGREFYGGERHEARSWGANARPKSGRMRAHGARAAAVVVNRREWQTPKHSFPRGGTAPRTATYPMHFSLIRTPPARRQPWGCFPRTSKSRRLYQYGLKDIYYAENQIVKSLPDMIENATNAELKRGLQQHLGRLRSRQDGGAGIRFARRAAERHEMPRHRRHHQGRRRPHGRGRYKAVPTSVSCRGAVEQLRNHALRRAHRLGQELDTARMPPSWRAISAREGRRQEADRAMDRRVNPNRQGARARAPARAPATRGARSRAGPRRAAARRRRRKRRRGGAPERTALTL